MTDKEDDIIMILQDMARLNITITDLINYINQSKPSKLIRDIIGLPTLSKKGRKS